MNKPLYQYIFDMLDYADALIPLIQPNESDNGNYFMTLLYIEDILDSYGRSFVRHSADASGEDGQIHMVNATRRMDELRTNIQELATTFDFEETIRLKNESMTRNWSEIYKHSHNLPG